MSTAVSTGVRLSGRRLLVARCAWLLLATVALTQFVLSLGPYYRALHTICVTATCSLDGALSPNGALALRHLGLSVDTYAAFSMAIFVLAAVIWTSVGLLIFWRKSDDWVAWLVALALVMFYPNGVTGGPVAALALTHAAWSMPVAALNFVAAVLIGTFFLIFPSGRIAPSWMIWVFGVYVATEAATLLLPSTSPLSTANWPGWLQALTSSGSAAMFLVAQVYRYRRVSTAGERQQTKWVVFGATVALAGLITLGVLSNVAPQILLPGGLELVTNALYILDLVVIPVAIAIAILRSRLWDIDVIINRTLVYGSLTALLAGVYFGSVLLMQHLAIALAGPRAGGNPLILVLSTLLIAALFQPLRLRLQRGIDRRFYRAKYDAAKTLEGFAATLRGEVDLAELQQHLVSVVEETLQPEHVSLWLRAPDR